MTATTEIAVVIIHFQSMGLRSEGLSVIYVSPRCESRASTSSCPDAHTALTSPFSSSSSTQDANTW